MSFGNYRTMYPLTVMDFELDITKQEDNSIWKEKKGNMLQLSEQEKRDVDYSVCKKKIGEEVKRKGGSKNKQEM